MSNINEKLASVENQITEIRSKFAPLSSKVSGLNEKINVLTDQIKQLADEAASVHNEIDTAGQGIESLFSLLCDAKNEGQELALAHEQLTAKHAEDEHLRNSMTAMFGEAFQVVSRFMDTAQRIGIINKDQAGSFLANKKADSDVAISPKEAPRQNVAEETKPDTEPISELNIQPEPESVTPNAPKSVEPIAEKISEEPKPEPLRELSRIANLLKRKIYLLCLSKSEPKRLFRWNLRRRAKTPNRLVPRMMLQPYGKENAESVSETAAETVAETAAEFPADFSAEPFTDFPEIPKFPSPLELDGFSGDTDLAEDLADTIDDATASLGLPDMSEISAESKSDSETTSATAKTLPSRAGIPAEKKVDQTPSESLLDELDLPNNTKNDASDLPGLSDFSLPSLPDVNDMAPVLSPTAETGTESTDTEEIVSQLDLPPLALETPETNVNEDSSSEIDEQTANQIEAMLKDMSKPIST